MRTYVVSEMLQTDDGFPAHTRARWGARLRKRAARGAMGAIQHSYDPTIDAILFDVQGAVSESEMTTAFVEQMTERPSDRIIWHFLDADLSNIGIADMRRIVERARDFEPMRVNPRTVFVARGRIEAILLKLYADIAGESISTTFHIAASREEALKWLGPPNHKG